MNREVPYRSHQLPPSWTWSTVGELTDVVRGGSPRPKGDPRYFGGSIPWIMISDVTRQPGKYLLGTREGVTQAGAERSRLIRSGELILSNSGTVCVPKILRVDGCIHDGFVAFPQLSRHVDLAFAYYWFDYIRPAVADQNRQGITQVNLNTRIVRDIPFPLACRDAQLRVVHEIEKQLSRVDAAIANLEAAQRKLKAYRASVLKAGVEGRLVPTEAELARKEGRSYEPADVLLERNLKERRQRREEAELTKMKAAGKTPKDDKWKPKHEPVRPDSSYLPALPEGWCWTRLDAVADVILGQQRSPAHAAAEIAVPYIRAANITWSGLDLSDVKRMGFVNPRRHRLESGDVLLSEASGSPMEAGKPVIWRDEIPGACFQNTVLRVRPDKATVLPEFLRLVFLRDCVTGQFARLAPGVGIVHIGAERLAQWPVPLASLPEQRRIVEEVERVLSVAEQNAINVGHDLRRCTRLRQAVLRWAFEGRLVDQYPADESADALLARIRAESAVASPAKAQPRRARKMKAMS